MVPAGLVDHDPVLQRSRIELTGPEADVSQEPRSINPNLQQGVRTRPRLVRLHPANPSYDVEPELLERCAEQQRVLVAVPAALPADQLRLDRVEPDPGMRPEDHVDVLERDRQYVRTMQTPQRVRRRRHPGVPDPREVGVQVKALD